MSLYNLLFGQNPLADVILATLGLRRSDVGRFRDCFVANGEIAVYTRNGGGNREDYESVFAAFREHPCYLRDEDDDFDCTYATIYFRFPAEYAEGLRKIDAGQPFDPDERWHRMIEAISKPVSAAPPKGTP